MGMAQEQAQAYRLLCWGACIPGYPCGMDYKGVRYETGDIIEMPPSVAQRHLDKGRLEVVEAAPKRGKAVEAVVEAAKEGEA